MSLKLKALHNVALVAGVQFTYICKFHSADLTRKSTGQTLWQTLDVNEAIQRWKKTISKFGGFYGEGQFQLVLEASVGQAGSEVKRNSKQDDSLDFWPEAKHSGVPEELSAAALDRPEDAGTASCTGLVGRGGDEGPRSDQGDATGPK